MGFLGSIGKFISSAPKTIAKTVTNPTKLTTAIVTGGASVVAPKLTAPITTAVSQLYNPALVKTAAGLALPGALGRAASFAPSLPSLPGGSMGFNLSNIIGGVTSGLGSLLTGGSPSTALSNFSSFLPSTGSFGTSGYGAVAQPTAMRLPAGAAAGAIVGRGFFNRFPNLAAVIQAWRNRGVNVTRAKLYGLLKRFGPDILVSGGILTAAAVSELMVAGPGRRRMNPGNVKALRRSLRRLESFHHLCQRADKLRRPRRGTKATGRGSAQQFVRQG